MDLIELKTDDGVVEAKHWTFLDRNEWTDAWYCEGEPDKLQWTDTNTGYACLIHRGPMGALCGYVSVPPEHPFFELDYMDCLKEDVHHPLPNAEDSGYSEDPNSYYQKVQMARWVCDDPGGCWSHSYSSRLEAHGGITYSGRGVRCTDGKYPPEQGLWFEGLDEFWLIGFDCSHLYDKAPGSDPMFREFGSVYRDVRYVFGEVTSLARQLHNLRTRALLNGQ